MSSVEEFLEATEKGTHPGCLGCAWNPQHIQYHMAYGRSCLRHCADWTKDGKAVSLQVVQDPGGTTPERTGLLCFVCNAASPTDNTATFNYALWQAGVSLSWDPGPIGPHSMGDSYLKKHFKTNCMMHGAPSGSQARLTRGAEESARQKCAPMILEQVRLLQPRILIASGRKAARSFYEIGLIGAPWEEVRNHFPRGAYREVRSNPVSSKDSLAIFCTYHTSIRAVNHHAARLYGDHTEQLIDERVSALPRSDAAGEFLKRYSNLTSATDRGMRALLPHWIDIGHAVRMASQDPGPSQHGQ